MTIPNTDVAMSAINGIINPSSPTSPCGLGSYYFRLLCGAGGAGTPVSMGNARGKPFSSNSPLTTIGTYSYMIPIYQYIDIYVSGAGGGGGGGGTHSCPYLLNGGSPGGNGGGSVFYGKETLYGGPGYGGNGGCTGGPGGYNGSGYGGYDQGAAGGGGGAGGASNNYPYCGRCDGQNGGTGNRRYNRYQFRIGNYPEWYGTYTVVVGGPGGGGARSPYGGGDGSAGGQGWISVYWW